MRPRRPRGGTVWPRPTPSRPACSSCVVLPPGLGLCSCLGPHPPGPADGPGERPAAAGPAGSALPC
eukprot:11211769-Lingulodinium_polyedra.AAC.1